jgi:hypothetical protein
VNLTVNPAAIPTVSVAQLKSSDTAIVFLVRRSKPDDACTVTVGAASPVSIPAGRTVATGWVTGLPTPANTYASSSSCTSGASWSGNLSTVATVTASASTESVVSRPPAALGADNALIEYGSTTAVSDGTVTANAASNWAADVPGNRGDLKFYRRKWRNGTTVLATGDVYPLIIE